MKNPPDFCKFIRQFLIFIATVLVLGSRGAVSVAVPNTSCYALDNSSHIYDFSSWVGHFFQYDGHDYDLVLRFCKDVEARAQSLQGYVDFGRFEKLSKFVAGSGNVKFVQRYYDGDLMNCENSFDKMGRTAQIDIICGDCPNGQCKGSLGCICEVKHESTCSILLQLAIPCEKPGPRVFEGFTVGFHPRTWEIVYNGLTQIGFEKAHNEFGFITEQSHVTLYMTAIASHSSLVQKPTVKVFPEQGLEVSLSGTGSTGGAPTTLSPSILSINWKCQKARDTPYEVEVTIPVENYNPVQFTLAKFCEYGQNETGNAARGWAIFGILSCVFIVLSTVFCIGGFIYKTRVENQRGLDALPGMTILSACLETVSGTGGGHSYVRPEDANSAFASQASWESHPASSSAGQATRRTTENSRYGAI